MDEQKTPPYGDSTRFFRRIGLVRFAWRILMDTGDLSLFVKCVGWLMDVHHDHLEFTSEYNRSVALEKALHMLRHTFTDDLHEFAHCSASTHMDNECPSSACSGNRCTSPTCSDHRCQQRIIADFVIQFKRYSGFNAVSISVLARLVLQRWSRDPRVYRRNAATRCVASRISWRPNAGI